MTPAINPCPFCKNPHCQVEADYMFKVRVACSNCHAYGPSFPWPDYCTKKNWKLKLIAKAILAWNRAHE